jgi:hypothetical protein
MIPDRKWWVLVFIILFWAAACTVQPEPQSTPAVTSGPAENQTSTPPARPASAGSAEYYSPELKLRLSYPAGWTFLDGDPGSEHYGGLDGFFRATNLAGGGMTLDELVQAEANHALQPFGLQPGIEPVQVGGIEGRRISPSGDQPKAGTSDLAWGEVVVPFPRPVMVNGILADYFILQADLAHLETLANTLQFEKLDPAEKLFAPESDTPAAGICQLVTDAVYIMTVSPDMPSPRCLQVPLGAIIGFNNQTGAPLKAHLGGYEFLLPENVEVVFNVPVGTYLAPGVHQLQLEENGSAPEIWVIEQP